MIGDERRLRQVLMNLVRNALKFTNRYGAVTIKVCHTEGFLVANVGDTGTGIAI